MNTLDGWLHTVSEALGLSEPVDRDLVLELTRDVAHHVARPAAPLTAFLVGLAAGRDGGGPEQVAALVARVTELARDYPGSDGD